MTIEELIVQTEMVMKKPLSMVDIEIIKRLNEQYDIPYESIGCVIENCVSSGKRQMRYIEKYAMNLAEQGIKTPEAINAHFETRKNSQLQLMVSRHLGRSVVGMEQQMIARWEEKGYSDELVAKAIDHAVAVNGIGGTSMMYADKLLDTWEKAGVDSPDKLQVFERNMHEKRKATSSYNRRTVSGGEPIVMVPARPDKNLIRFDVAELKSCPFCGDEKIGIKCQYSSKYDAFFFVVECNCCGANTRSIVNNEGGSPEDEAFWQSTAVEQVVTLWNNRI